MAGPTAAGRTDIGLHRENNEDAFLLLPGAGAYAVADGMGGPAFGEVAAAMFLDAVRRTVPPGGAGNPAHAARLVLEAFRLANREILSHASLDPSRQGMGCTAELVLFSGGEYAAGHVGDSRIYRLRGGELSRVTKDHSLVQRQVDQGLLSEADARVHPMRNVVLRAVGTAERVEPDLHSGRLEPGDLLLLCSDGLTDMVDDAGIADALRGAGSLEERAARLISLALEAGGRDNVTVVLCGWPVG